MKTFALLEFKLKLSHQNLIKRNVFENIIPSNDDYDKSPDEVLCGKISLGGFFMSEEEIIEQFGKMLSLRGFTSGTVKDYWFMFNRFQSWCHDGRISLSEITYEQVQNYVLYLKNIVQYAPKTVNSNISFIRFLFIYVLRRPIDRYMLPYSRVDVKAPEILSKDEIVRFIEAMPNLKAKAIVTLLYSCGLRVSEVVALRYEDISRERKTVHIAHSKNRSARYVPLSDAALRTLTEYWIHFGKPRNWLFPGNSPEKPIKKDTVFAYIKETKEKLGWTDRRITSHTFRHCLGTHMYEAGYDLPYIQKFLGHKAITSTMVYITLTGRKDYPLLLDTMM